MATRTWAILSTIALCCAAGTPLDAAEPRPGFGRIDPGDHPVDVTSGQDAAPMSDWFTPEGEPVLPVEQPESDDAAAHRSAAAPASPTEVELPEPRIVHTIVKPAPERGPRPFVGPLEAPEIAVTDAAAAPSAAVRSDRPRSVLDGLRPTEPVEQPGPLTSVGAANQSAPASVPAAVVPQQMQAGEQSPAPATLVRPGASDLPLGPTRDADTQQASRLGTTVQNGGAESYVRTGAALAVVLGSVLLLAWLVRKMMASRPGLAAAIGGGPAPAGILEVLGRYPIGPKQSLVLLKFDRRILLLSQSGSRGAGGRTDTLCELSEPEDVASILVKVREHAGKSPAGLFSAAMRSAEKKTSAALEQGGPLDGALPFPRPQAAKTEPSPLRETSPNPFAMHRPAAYPTSQGNAESEAAPEINVPRSPGVAPRSLHDESDREALWSVPDARPTPAPGEDPVGLLRRRLEAMRRGERVG